MLISTTILIVDSLVGVFLSKPLRPSNRSKLKLTVPFILVLSLLILGGAILIIVDGRNIQEGLTRKKWPTVEGQIISSDVVGGRIFQPEVGYSFTVDQKSYMGNTDLKVPYFGPSSARKEVAYKTVADYQVGSKVDVFYNPADPEESYLKPGATWDQYTRLSLGTLFYGLGVFGLCTYFLGNTKS